MLDGGSEVESWQHKSCLDQNPTVQTWNPAQSISDFRKRSESAVIHTVKYCKD
jgi:hypothetical protein